MNDLPIGGIMPIPVGSKDTIIRTACCEVAIGDTESRCPECNMLIQGFSHPPGKVRGAVRLRKARAHWNE